MIGSSNLKNLGQTVGLLLAAHAWFLLQLATRLWSREHYQFFPLILIAAGALAYFRWRECSWNSQPCITIRTGVLSLISVCLFIVAVISGSPLIGTLSFISSLWTAICFWGGQQSATELRSPVFLTLLILPLPSNLDLAAITGLQKIATKCASRLLDLVQIRHGVEGVALSTAKKQFLVEEACSGIHSLFSCVCAVVLISVIWRSGLLRILINICQAIVWVIAANALRVFLIVYAFEKYGMELDVGLKHDLLGVLTYGIALSLSLSFDRLMEFAIPRGKGMKSGVLFESSKRLQAELNRARMDLRVSRRAIYGVATVILTLGLWNMSTAARSWFAQSSTTPTTAGAQVFSKEQGISIDSKLVPRTAGNWKLEKVETIQRDPDDPLGMTSLVHFYNGNGLSVQFSVDGYYEAWHDLAYCYSALDWKLRSQENTKIWESKDHRTDLVIYRETGEFAAVIFGCYDSAGNSVQPGKATLGVVPTMSLLKERLFGKTEAAAPIAPPVLQLQLLCITDHELLPHEINELRDLYSTLAGAMIPAIRGEQQ